jgi:signal transduction histidine kinase
MNIHNYFDSVRCVPNNRPILRLPKGKRESRLGSRRKRGIEKTVKIFEVGEHDRRLIADVARRLQPRLAALAERWIREISPAAPLADLTHDELIALARDTMIEFFDNLANENLQGAFEGYAASLERLPRGLLISSGGKPIPMDHLFRTSYALCRLLREEVALTFAPTPELLPGALLWTARLWNLATEPTCLLYFRLCDQYSADQRRELIAARDAALEESRVKSAFVATMTHEIRTPLNIILGYADLLAERLAELHDDGGLQYAEPIRRSGQRLLQTIGAILDLSRIESGAYQITPAPLTLDAVVDRQIQDLRMLARKKNLELDYRNDAREAVVTFDEHCLSNIVINLLQNAIKFTEQGTVSVHIFRDDAGALSLEVRDTGVGIDAAYLPYLFDPFSRETHGAALRYEGTGLGLALVKRYVELNGASISVASVKHQGSVFTITFPRDAAID